MEFNHELFIRSVINEKKKKSHYKSGCWEYRWDSCCSVTMTRLIKCSFTSHLKHHWGIHFSTNLGVFCLINFCLLSVSIWLQVPDTSLLKIVMVLRDYKMQWSAQNVCFQWLTLKWFFTSLISIFQLKQTVVEFKWLLNI